MLAQVGQRVVFGQWGPSHSTDVLEQLTLEGIKQGKMGTYPTKHVDLRCKFVIFEISYCHWIRFLGNSMGNLNWKLCPLPANLGASCEFSIVPFQQVRTPLGQQVIAFHSSWSFSVSEKKKQFYRDRAPRPRKYGPPQHPSWIVKKMRPISSSYY